MSTDLGTADGGEARELVHFVTQQALADSADVTTLTIRNRCRELPELSIGFYGSTGLWT
ncbi:hypothetical protein [Halorarum halophilum]|uniref:hypothetical protein n=1 Tax=Halorarum halophilum TaxID=2743090 RepID=UPI001C4F1D42|nr:hypothetical protein [Halobaculum halophilum]